MPSDRADVVATFANSGALGMITIDDSSSPDRLAAEISRTRELTDRPFGVNLGSPSSPDVFRQVIIDSGISVVGTGGSSPALHLQDFHAAGVKVIHTCASVKHAVEAQSVGVDGIVIESFVDRDHSVDDPALALILAAADRLVVPLIAAAGAGDSRILVAAIALGADAISIEADGDVSALEVLIDRIMHEAGELIQQNLGVGVTN